MRPRRRRRVRACGGRKKKSRAVRMRQLNEKREEEEEGGGEGHDPEADDDANEGTDATTDATTTGGDVVAVSAAEDDDDHDDDGIPMVEVISPLKFLEDLDLAVREWLRRREPRHAPIGRRGRRRRRRAVARDDGSGPVPIARSDTHAGVVAAGEYLAPQAEHDHGGIAQVQGGNEGGDLVDRALSDDESRMLRRGRDAHPKKKGRGYGFQTKAGFLAMGKTRAERPREAVASMGKGLGT